MQYLAQVSQPRGRHFYQKCHISNPGGTILTKNVLTYFQSRGQDFDQICPIYNPGGTILTKNVIDDIANTCGMILAKFIIKYILNT